ncbi:DUF4386 domain-containing protein [Celeribacter arenosi]|uniref:DUF4386 domain-containing protein n=1 Tax=Celeribacter arenosi TaxID=792649 RepID=A0ABP7KBQ1_9RHOB
MQVILDPQSSQFARLTGVAYLSIAVFGAYAIGYVPSQIVVAGDAAATVANINEKRALYLSGIGADALVMLIEIFATVMLYAMFRPVSPVLAKIAAVARLMMVAVMAGMLFFHAGALALIDGSFAALSDAQRAEMVGWLFDMHHAGVWIWQLFFFVHLALLGRLVDASNRFPKILGLALTIGAFGYLLDSLYAFAFSQIGWLGIVRIGFLVVVTLGEVGFALWLTIRAPRATPTH